MKNKQNINTVLNWKKIALKKGGKFISKERIKTNTYLKWECKKGHIWQTTPTKINQGYWCPYCSGRKKTIEDMQKLASKKNGKCLSKKYINSDTKLQWKCEKGHIWMAVPFAIKAGGWCPYCRGRYKTIKDMHELARKKNGKCLSRKYIKNSIKLKWQCENGHSWQATPGHIINGTWCPYCYVHYKTIKDMHELARKKNGKCLSKKYINASTELKWQCAKGHIWKAAPHSLNRNCWCPYCSGRRTTIQDLIKLAKNKNGRCLSKEYIDSKTHLEWKCFKGHIWQATPSAIKQGSWCPVCGKRKITIQDLNILAKQKGGKCLSDIYINKRHKLEWQCKKKHVWKTTPATVQSGSWCPVCAKEKLKKTINDMQKLAAKKNGKCISNKYINANTHLKWKCENGHIWQATPSKIKQGNWCPFCSGRKKTIEDMQKLAAEKNGKCLSKKYINPMTKLRWHCEKGHTWKSRPRNIINGHWCPFCSGRKKTIEDWKKLATQKNGKCISKKYINPTTKLRWQCEKGHTWLALPYNVYSGQCCPYCLGKHKTINDMKKLAIKKNGKCLSKKYINNSTKLKWKCEKGHTWMAKPAGIQNGTWCPYCIGRHKTIDDMRKLASNGNGKCLSKKYIKNSVKLKWQCNKKHIWEATPANVARGQWCPFCAGRRKTIKDFQILARRKNGKCLSKIYKNSSIKLKWQCKKGHNWMAKPKSILNGVWCPKCTIENRMKNQKKTKIPIKLPKETFVIFGD
jgi:thiol-disulfide isomerase/thioredoxin